MLTATGKYDISACDINTMRWGVFLYAGHLSVTQFPFAPWLYVALCVSTVATLTYVLYILQPTQEQLPTGVPAAQQSLGYGLVNACVATTTIMAAHAHARVFLTREDEAGFWFAVATFYFYIVLTIVTQHGDDPEAVEGSLQKCVRMAIGTWALQTHGAKQPLRYEPGLALDTLVLALQVACIGMYSCLEHPFNAVTLASLLFRMWNKIIRLGYGHGFSPTVPFLVVRLLLDCVNVAFGICCAWNTSHEVRLVAAVWFAPLILGMYALAKIVFLSCTQVS